MACGTDRSNASGACGVMGLKIAKYYLHPFEEPAISFKKGSGCIFFCGCSLRCVFCQNFDLSRNNRGVEITPKRLSEIFRELEDKGAENINLVTPTHYVRDIAAAFEFYRPDIPVVYNTHGYETEESLRIAEEFTDIWLTDLKFLDPTLAKRYTARADYAEYAVPAVKFMARKKLEIRADGKMLSGCIVRHLVLPCAVYDSCNIIDFVAGLNKEIYLSLMSQYTPCGNAKNFPELTRKITAREYGRVKEKVKACGLERVYLQDISSASENYIPEWDF